MNSLWTFVLLWGVWLLIPILVDGIDALVRLVRVKTRGVGEEKDPVPDDALPTVAIIVPAHNEAELIDRCLTSVRAQDYPHDKLEVIVVDDGSTDGTAEIAETHAKEVATPTLDMLEAPLPADARRTLVIRGESISVGPFGGRFLVSRNGHGGKSHALNTGIDASSAEIIVNIDSDVVLAPGSVRAIAEAFAREPGLGAVTGNIEIDWELLEDRDTDGNIIVGQDGLPVPRHLGPIERFLAKSQFLEYLSSFRLGRHAQSVNDSMFTLAGACSAFRRSAIEAACGYSNRTVSEDTDVTWALHKAGVSVGFVPRARVLLEPVTSWDDLYGQRVRWARGQLEVSALNKDTLKGQKGRGRGGQTMPNLLLFDHTLAFPRLVWVPLILFFPLLGYSPKLIAVAIVAMYALYLIIEAVSALAAFGVAEEDTRTRVEHCGLALLGLPLYRFVVFHFRFSGFLMTLTEDQQWTVPGGFDRTLQRFDIARLRTVQMAGLLLRTATHLGSLVLTAVVQLAAPMLIGLALVIGQAIMAVQRRNS
jgi:cellulose synthase/poly-beta-1,6-N-acetylglucosamine synthase-like glycosyltransferase